MAVVPVLASNAIGGIFSACAGATPSTRSASGEARQTKRKRGIAGGGGGNQQAGTSRAIAAAQAHSNSLPGGWWTGSSDDMEGGEAKGQAENGGGATPPVGGGGGPSEPTLRQGEVPQEYVNEAYSLWSAQRLEWNRGGSNRRHKSQQQGSLIGSDTTYEDLLATSRPFLQPIPLPEMVDFLVECWDQEGLYD